MKEQNSKKFIVFLSYIILVLLIFISFKINPILGIFLSITHPIWLVLLMIVIIYLEKNIKTVQQQNNLYKNKPVADFLSIQNISIENEPIILTQISTNLSPKTKLEKRKKYLQIALNSTLEEALEIISQLPISDRILIEVGTPLIKIYGTEAVSQIKEIVPPETYIVADSKCVDLAMREVEMMANAGANAVTCLGVAPIETIDIFIEECQKKGIDSMIDMMNVKNPVSILKELKKLPDVVILHRGVDETEFSKEKQIPYSQINQIKDNFDILVSVAGGDTIDEVQRAILNGADIIVVWKAFYQSTTETAKLAERFLKEII